MQKLDFFFEQKGVSCNRPIKRLPLIESMRNYLTPHDEFIAPDDRITTDILIFNFLNNVNGFKITSPEKYFSNCFLSLFSVQLRFQVFESACFFYNPVDGSFTCRLDERCIEDFSSCNTSFLLTLLAPDTESRLSLLFMSESDRSRFVSDRLENLLCFQLNQKELARIFSCDFPLFIRKHLKVDF